MPEEPRSTHDRNPSPTLGSGPGTASSPMDPDQDPRSTAELIEEMLEDLRQDEIATARYVEELAKRRGIWFTTSTG